MDFYCNNHKQVLDSNEHEVINTSEYGLNVTIVFNNDKVITINNCTEIHYRYENTDRIAFESDIHSTGITMDIKDMKIIITVEANEIYKHF